MANKAINELPAAESISPSALMVIYQDAATQRITGAQVIQLANVEVYGAAQEAKSAAESAAESAADAQAAAQAVQDLGVSAQTIPAGQSAIVEKQISETGVVTLVFSIPQGAQGVQGEQGVSVTAAEVLEDGTLQLTLSSGSTLNAGSVIGPQGEQGVQGPQGPQGVSIQSIQRTAGTGAPGTTDTYTITLTNGSTFEFQVYNGADGGVTTFNGRSGAVEPQKGDYTAEQVGAIPQVNGAAGQFLGFTAENVVGAVDAPSGGGEATRLRKVVTAFDWSGNYATLTNAFFQTGDFIYLLSPDTDNNFSMQAFPAAGISAYSVVTEGELTLKAQIPPNDSLVVVITKVPTTNGNGNVYCSSGFWINENEIYGNVSSMLPASAVYVYSSTTIPAGRMIGDVNGDGQITNEDYVMISEIATEVITPTEIEKECADIDGSGSVNPSDMLIEQQTIAGQVKLGQYSRDVLGNWSVNPNYATEEAQFYIDVTAAGLTASSNIALAVQGDGADQIVRVEAMSGAFRVYAKLLPINPLPYKLIQ